MCVFKSIAGRTAIKGRSLTDGFLFFSLLFFFLEGGVGAGEPIAMRPRIAPPNREGKPGPREGKGRGGRFGCAALHAWREKAVEEGGWIGLAGAGHVGKPA